MLRVLLTVALFACVAGCARQTDGPGTKEKGHSRSADASPDKGGASDNQGSSAKGKKTALLVGVKEYKGGGFNPLKYTERDVEELAAILTRAGYEVRLLTTQAGKSKAADAPTAANIRKAFADLIKGRGRGDTVLLALSGHGIQADVEDPKKEKDPNSYGYFCPTDADTTDIRYSTGYSDHLILITDLFEQLGRCGASNKLVLMDACRNEVSVKGRTRNAAIDVANVPNGVAALFSCSRRERAWEHDDLKHGVFFHHVLKGLRGEAKNKRGAVTWDALSAYVKDEVEVEVPKLIGGGARQKPAGVNNLEGNPVLLVVGGEAPGGGGMEHAYQEQMKAAKDAMDAKKYDEAVKAYDAALKIKPDDKAATAGKRAAAEALKPPPPPPRAKLFRVKKAIAENILTDDKGEFLGGVSIQKGQLVRRVDQTNEKVKIQVGGKSGWLTNQEVEEYLEEAG